MLELFDDEMVECSEQEIVEGEPREDPKDGEGEVRMLGKDQIFGRCEIKIQCASLETRAYC